MAARTVLVGMGIAAMALTVLTPHANAAEAEGHLGFGGQSAVGTPGGTVPIEGWCTADPFVDAKVSSPVLHMLEAKATGDGTGKRIFAGRAQVRKDAKPGVYPVFFGCGGKKVETRLTIRARSADDKVTVEPGQLRIVPNKVVAGQKVALWWHSTSCGDDVQISGRLVAGKASAPAGMEDDLRLKAPATVHKGLQPGTYPVTVKCGGTMLTAKVTVVAKKIAVAPKGAPATGGGPVG